MKYVRDSVNQSQIKPINSHEMNSIIKIRCKTFIIDFPNATIFYFFSEICHNPQYPNSSESQRKYHNHFYHHPIVSYLKLLSGLMHDCLNAIV